MLGFLLLIVVLGGGCNQTGPTSVPATALSTPVPTLQPIFVSQGLVQPDWTEIKLPSGCDAGELSRDSQWLTYYCPRPQQMPEGWLIYVRGGQIENPKPLNGMRSLGFTLDGSGLIIKKEDNTWWLMHLPDFTQQPYFPGLDDDAYPAWGIIWSPDHSLAAIDDAWRNIFVLSPRDQTLAQVVKAPTQNGAQFSWAPDSQEIVYVEGLPVVGDGSMAVRVVNVQSRVSRTLLEGQLNISGASWSPDGKWIAIRAGGFTRSSALWLVDPHGDRSVKFEYDWGGTDSLDGWFDLVWSPDGSKLALRARGEKPEERVLIIEVPSGKVIQQITGYMKPLGWSTDGKSLLVQAYDSDEEQVILRWLSIQP